MKKILISACLVGDKTRYDGKGNYHPLVKELLQNYELVPFCSEVEGGLKIPREPSEIQKDGKVINKKGIDVSKNYLEGAIKAYNLCVYLGIDTVILKDGSPACGVYEIHDGNFKGNKIKGQGITAKYLSARGIKVLSENDIEELLKK